MARKKQSETTSSTDWARLKKRFEATISKELSGRELAIDFGITEGAIRQKAKAEGWLRRDQREKFQAVVASQGISPSVNERVERVQLDATQIERVSTLFQKTGTPIAAIAIQLGVTIADIDFCIARHSDWKKYAGEGALKDADSPRTADPETVAALKKSPVPEMSEKPKPVTRREFRSAIGKIKRRAPDRDLRAAKRLKPEQLVTIARDVLDRLICQIDDIIGNRDIIITLLEEAGEEGAISATRYAILEHAFDIVKLSGAARQVASAAKLLVEQSEARSGKKERQKEEAVSLSETGRFRKRGAGPRLVATGGEPV